MLGAGETKLINGVSAVPPKKTDTHIMIKETPKMPSISPIIGRTMRRTSLSTPLSILAIKDTPFLMGYSGEKEDALLLFFLT